MKTVFVISVGSALLEALDDIDTAKRRAEQMCCATIHQAWQRLPGGITTEGVHLRILELHHEGKIKALVREIPHVVAA